MIRGTARQRRAVHVQMGDQRLAAGPDAVERQEREARREARHRRRVAETLVERRQGRAVQVPLVEIAHDDQGLVGGRMEGTAQPGDLRLALAHAQLGRAHIRHGLEHVDAAKIVVAPDCGLKYLPREVAFGKMQAMVAGAAIVRRELAAVG